MKLKNIQPEFELIVKLLNSVNSKEEFDYLSTRMKEISSSSFIFHQYKAERRYK